jgi:hypothetical protein
MATLSDFNFGTWQQRFSEGYEADRIGSFGWSSIQPVNIPYVFVEQYIRVSITANYKKDTWKQAANLYQTIPTFLGNSDIISEHLISLGKPEILDLTQYPDGYRLRLEFFPWLRDVNVLIHAWRF